jgi:hypothetical protein
MKIKTGFVTNSSSSITIVYIPHSYPITTKKIMDAYKKQKKWNSGYEDYMKEDIIEYFNEAMNNLKSGDILDRYQDETIPDIIYSVIAQILDDEGLVIRTIEKGVSESDSIVSLDSERVEKLLNIYTLYGGKK